MIQRYCIEISYDGSAYHGWQKQPDHPTIQGHIEQALSILFRQDISIMGSGRTDTGVNAIQQFAHFDVEYKNSTDIDEHSVIHSLRGLLPHDILVSKMNKVPLEFHARFDAKSRQYRYRIATQNDVFENRYTWVIDKHADVSAISQNASIFIGEHEFSSFCKQNPDVLNNICTIYESRIEVISPHRFDYIIHANRFLHHMVRSIVGRLVDSGTGKCTSTDLHSMLLSPDKKYFQVKAPSHALFLEKVVY